MMDDNQQLVQRMREYGNGGPSIQSRMDSLWAANTIESLQAKVAELETLLKSAYVLTDWTTDTKTAAERAAVLDKMDRYFQDRPDSK